MFMFGSFHLIIVLVLAALYLVPISKILTRTGFNGWLCLLALVPLLNLVMLWVFASTPWPALPGRTD